jgi:hypothetical protein
MSACLFFFLLSLVQYCRTAPPSSSGPGRGPFKAKTGVRISVGALPQNAGPYPGALSFEGALFNIRPKSNLAIWVDSASLPGNLQEATLRRAIGLCDVVAAASIACPQAVNLPSTPNLKVSPPPTISETGRTITCYAGLVTSCNLLSGAARLPCMTARGWDHLVPCAASRATPQRAEPTTLTMMTET